MFKLTLAISIIMAFTACSQDSIILNNIENPPQVEIKNISQITIPVREHGYSNFKTTFITSKVELNKFIEKIKLQKYWKKKKNFLATLLLKKINFNNSNLLLYRITESSGSTVLLVDPPKGDNKHIKIIIGENELQIGTTDMAYYALAYRVSKSVADITFQRGKKEDIIKNPIITTKTTLPSECLEWYDGCNTCGRVGEEGTPVCTEMFCSRPLIFKCTKWKEHSKPSTPDNEPEHHETEQYLPHSPPPSSE